MSNEMLTKIDGVYYREVARRAKVGELVKMLDYLHGNNGDILRVREVDSDGIAQFEGKRDGEGSPQYDRGRGDLYVVLEPVARDKCAREVLAEEKRNNEIDEIARIGLRLAKVSRKLDEVQRDVREMVYGKPERKPAGPTRDDVIKRAKADVATLSRGLDLSLRINREGRSVVARISTSDRYKDLVVRVLQSRGIARCSPGDVFNIHIGKAIALRRALGYTVPDEYVNAPRPVMARVGDVVKYTHPYDLSKKKVLVIERVIHDEHYFSDGTWDYGDYFEIIDDSRTGSEKEDYGI